MNYIGCRTAWDKRTSFQCPPKVAAPHYDLMKYERMRALAMGVVGCDRQRNPLSAVSDKSSVSLSRAFQSKLTRSIVTEGARLVFT